MSFWPLKDFHKLTKHWDLAFWLLVPPDTELSDSLAMTSFPSSLGGSGDGFAYRCPEPGTRKPSGSWRDRRFLHAQDGSGLCLLSWHQW